MTDHPGQPAWSTFTSPLELAQEARSEIGTLLHDLEALDAVGETLSAEHRQPALEILAMIRETAETYTRVMTELPAIRVSTRV